MPDTREMAVHLAYDAEADIWYVAQSDIPGLRLEAESPSRLIERITECAAELIALNESENQPDLAKMVRTPLSIRPIFDNGLALA